MNNGPLVTGGIIILIAMIGLVYYVNQSASPSPIATTTPIVIPNPTPVPPPVASAPQPGVPKVMTDVAVSPSDTTVVVTGTVTPNGALTSYWYEYSTASDLTGYKSSPRQSIGSGFVSIPAPSYITLLAKNTTYYFRLVAENSFGKSSGTPYSFLTTQNTPPPVGSAPTTKTLAASGLSRNTANLNGEITPNKATTGYWFEYGSSANLGNTTAFQSIGNGSAKVPASISLTDLNPLTTYYFRLNAQNQFGTVNGAILNFKTTGPALPTEPSVSTKSATIISTSSATLPGTVNPNGEATMYWFEYSTDSLLGTSQLRSTEKKSAGSGRDAQSVVSAISGLTPDMTYYFRVVAQNSINTVRGEQGSFKTKKI